MTQHVSDGDLSSQQDKCACLIQLSRMRTQIRSSQQQNFILCVGISNISCFTGRQKPALSSLKTHTTRIDGTSGNTWLPHHCRKSAKLRSPKFTCIQGFKEKAGGRWMLQATWTSLPQPTEDRNTMASVSKVQKGPRSAIPSRIPSYTHKGCRTRSNILFNYRYRNN